MILWLRWRIRARYIRSWGCRNIRKRCMVAANWAFASGRKAWSLRRWILAPWRIIKIRLLSHLSFPLLLFKIVLCFQAGLLVLLLPFILKFSELVICKQTWTSTIVVIIIVVAETIVDSRSLVVVTFCFQLANYPLNNTLMKIINCGKYLFSLLILLRNNLWAISVHVLRMSHRWHDGPHVSVHRWRSLRLARYRHWCYMWVWRRTSHHGRANRWRLHQIILRWTIWIIKLSRRRNWMTAHLGRSLYRHIITRWSRSIIRLILGLIVWGRRRLSTIIWLLIVGFHFYLFK